MRKQNVILGHKSYPANSGFIHVSENIHSLRSFLEIFYYHVSANWGFIHVNHASYITQIIFLKSFTIKFLQIKDSSMLAMHLHTLLYQVSADWGFMHALLLLPALEKLVIWLFIVSNGTSCRLSYSSSQQAKQSSFSTSRRSHQCQNFSRIYCTTDPIQNVLFLCGCHSSQNNLVGNLSKLQILVKRTKLC